ncbi:NifB/NifX family molybdenum-iron cluster-binding protein [Saccharicrinis fermentans]|uniref:Nitrogenase cofactor biosynthesis protein NifB n=1 Tax=Saccharicrinis fermentans DSM 9555 = JCM 21142 TaxID=869213 RepID=W7Y8I1_9BACT|nr:NifB/NifX family molybdenum-iron cluster-binding protein [Saccharicrinis fermentans]GAF04557.1 nitrogenase cofactor biosynthesis protein NifB [Saccharicrinis fermentans DSM 9555 = JCM 21142]
MLDLKLRTKKVALPFKGEQVDKHFGHCEKFVIYTLSAQNKILNTSFYEGAEDCGCKSNLAEELAKEGVEVLLAGGIGQGAIVKLKAANVEVFMGFSGATDQVLAQWLSGNKGNSEVCPPHDEEGHQCGNH